jgi:hypothetical protein
VVGEVRVIDMLRERALETLELAGPEDRFWLIRAGAPWEPALPGDPAETAARVRDTEPVGTGADLGAAIARAHAVLAAGADGRAREIQLLTDLQATSFPTAPPPGDDAALIVWTPGGPPPPNRAVTRVEIGGGLAPVAGERTAIVASIGGVGTDSVNVRLSVDGRVVAAATAAPGDAAVLTLPARAAGLVEGHIEIDADPLRMDNRRYFALRILPPPGVALSAPAEFIDNALAVMTGVRRVQPAPLTTADVAILPGGVGLESLAPQRAVAVLPPESPLELPAVNRRLAAAGIPWQYDAPVAAGEARFAPTADPLLRSLEAVRVRSHYPLRPAGAATDSVLLALQDGAPWAVRGQRPAGGTYVLLASPLDEAATTLPTGPALLPLLDRMIGSWLAPHAVAVEALPGAEHALPAAADSVRRPDGVTEPLGGGGSYRFGGEPGTYEFIAGDSLLQLVAVNTTPAASDLRRLTGRQALAALGAGARITESPRDWARAVYHARLGRELWRPLVLLALLLLLGEAALAASGRRRVRNEPGV